MYLSGKGEKLIYGRRILFGPHQAYNGRSRCREIPEL
jgi:hypothetical protein